MTVSKPTAFAQESERRRVVANAVLATFSPASISKTDNGWAVCWQNLQGGKFSRRWQTGIGSDFYPPWAYDFPCGGTSMTALAQLMRWLQRRPVFPIMTWRTWEREAEVLLPSSAVDALLDGGYPVNVPCVLCGETLSPGTGIDWWRKDGLSGPCCSYWKPGGCRQKKEIWKPDGCRQKKESS